jgi:hypothetical protein
MAQTDQDSQYRLITKPAEGKDPWASDYYDFVDTADKELVPQGTVSERDATNPHDGALWYVIDGSDEYLTRYDGGTSSWVDASVNSFKGNDLDSDGDGKVDEADSADVADDVVTGSTITPSAIDPPNINVSLEENDTTGGMQFIPDTPGEGPFEINALGQVILNDNWIRGESFVFADNDPSFNQKAAFGVDSSITINDIRRGVYGWHGGNLTIQDIENYIVGGNSPFSTEDIVVESGADNTSIIGITGLVNITVDANSCSVVGCSGSNEIVINGDNCAITGNSDTTVTDNGSGNAIGDNT